MARSTMARVAAERFIAALREVEERGNVAPMAELHAPEAEISNVTMAEPHRGPAGARRFWTKYRESFTRVHSEFRNIAGSDDAALLEWTTDATTAAGVETRYDGVSVVEFGGGKIRRFRAYFDPAALTGSGGRAAMSRGL